MSSKLLELHVRARIARMAILEHKTSAADRLRDDERGVVTPEWIALMVGIVALAGVLAGAGIWQTVANEIVQSVDELINQVAGKGGGSGGG